MARFYIGIDPGQKGGIAIIDKGKDKIHLLAMPLLDDKEGLDVLDIKRWIFGMTDQMHLCNYSCFCYIEKSQAMPQQGVTSMFNYGKGYGELIALLKILEIPFKEIRPRVWKKTLGLERLKSESVKLAEELYPRLSGMFVTKRGRLLDGIAEALLIAHLAKLEM